MRTTFPIAHVNLPSTADQSVVVAPQRVPLINCERQPPLRTACRRAQGTDQIALAGGTTPRSLCLCTMGSHYNPSRAGNHRQVAEASEASEWVAEASEWVAEAWDCPLEVSHHSSA